MSRRKASYWKPKICQNGHKFWVQAYTRIKYNQRQPELPIEPASDRIPKIRGTPEGIRGTPERILKFCGTGKNSNSRPTFAHRNAIQNVFTKTIPRLTTPTATR
jgi:hypothetical protein